jgi:LPXTG-motif cell wall-anchored protein
MPARTLVTIGDLRAQPLRRTRTRRLGHVDPFRYRERSGMGSATPATGGAALQDATATLLNYLEMNGAPSEHVSDPQVLAYQKVWNADPANASDQLSPDGGYGPLTQGTLDVMTGGIAPAVNTGQGPAPSPSPMPPPGVLVVPASGGSDMGWLLIAGGAGLLAYLLFFRKKKHGHHARPGALVEVKTNPRRRRARASGAVV